MNHHSVKPLPGIHRTSGVPQKQYGPGTASGAEEAVGQRDGVWVKAVPSKTSRAAGRSLKASQNPVAGRSVKLSEHRVRAEQAIKPMALDDIGRLAASIVMPKGLEKQTPKGLITQAAQRMLRREDPKLPDGPEGDKLRLLASHLALHCLDANVDAQARTALLTPVGPFTREPRAIAQHLRSADGFPEEGEAEEARIELIKQFKAAGGRTGDSKATLQDDAHKLQRYDEEALTAQLAEWLAIPAIDADREELDEKVRNDLANFKSSPDGQRALKELNSDRVAQTTDNPAKFKKTFSELAERAEQSSQTDPSVARDLLLLAKNHSLDELPLVINKLTTAASDNLNADNPANGAEELGATVTELGKLRIENTIVPLFKRLKERVDYAIRTRGASSAAAA